MTANDYLSKSFSVFNREYSIPVFTNKGSVIIETRRIKNFGLIVKNHLYFMPKEYGLTVFHSNENEPYIREQLQDIIGVNYQNIGEAKLSASAYNVLLTSKHFWNLIPYQKVLIFQADSLLLRNGINLFEGYDYIGAPWGHMNKEVGNGGLSLRSKDIMLNIASNVIYKENSHGNEDVYFSKLIKQFGGIIASHEVANHFSVETMYYSMPIGIHAADKFLKRKQMEMIYNTSLNELRLND